jgi:HlyD family secretion protein
LLTLVAAAVVGALVWAVLPKPVGIDVATVARGPLQVTVDEDGQTRIKERYIVSTPLSGRLLRIGHDVGDTVIAGETILARIEPTDPALLDPRARAQAEARVNAAEARLNQSATTLEKSRAALEFAESELGRLRRLLETRAATPSQVEEQELRFRTETQEYKAARFTEEIARFELELEQAALLRTTPNGDSDSSDGHFIIHAPISGRVLKVFQESATVVTPGAQLLELGDPTDLEVVVDVLSSDAVRIVPGAKALLDQWGGEAPLETTVALVEPSGFTKISALGVEEQRVNVILEFDDPVEQRATLGDGFRVEAHIVVWEAPTVIRVPNSALIRHRQDWAVFTLQEGRARLRIVTIGHQNSLDAEVLSGLDDGEQIIVHPSDQVADGVAVFER